MGITHAAQRVILALGARSARVGRRRPPISWVIGPDEIASMVMRLSEAVPDSFSVSLTRHVFYDFDYDFSFRPGRFPAFEMIKRLVIAPFLLGRLAMRAKGFIYVGASGFLVGSDDRDYEFAWLRRHGVKVVCFFVGDDIRAPRRMHELETTLGRPNISTTIGSVDAFFESDEYDLLKRHIAAVADRRADIIFSNQVDSCSYLERHVEPFPLMYPDKDFIYLPGKYENIERAVLVHAPSSPLLKGTPSVREAVERLRAEGYDFEYQELVGASNSEVRAQLARAHIVLNQFYGFLPGMFGLEALASTTVMLCSADESVEPSIPSGGNSAWVVTLHGEIYENLKRLLDSPESWGGQAERGFRWAQENWAASVSGARFVEQLERIL